MKKNLFVWIWLLLCGSVTIGFAQKPLVSPKPTPIVSQTLVCRLNDGKTPVTRQNLIATYQGDTRTISVTGSINNNGIAVMQLPSGIPYTVQISNMKVINDKQFSGRNPVIITARPNSEDNTNAQKKQIQDLKNKRDFLAEKLKEATELSKTEKARYQAQLDEMQQVIDSLSIALDDEKTINDARNREITRLQRELQVLQEEMVFATTQISELNCQEFIRNEVLSIRFNFRYLDWNTTLLKELPKRELKLNMSVKTIIGKRIEPLVDEDGNELVSKTVSLPTSEYIDMEFKVSRDYKKYLTDAQDYIISIGDGNRIYNLDFIINPAKGTGCFPTTKTYPWLVGKGEADCGDLMVEIWDSGDVDGDAVTLKNLTTGATIFDDLTLKGEKEAARQGVTLKEGDNVIELTGIRSGKMPTQVSAALRFYCKSSGRFIQFKSLVQDRSLGSTLKLTNRVRKLKDEALINETRTQVIITYRR